MTKKTDMDIETLEADLKRATEGTEALFRSGKIPTPADYAEVDRIKAELKVARRSATMKAIRKAPVKTRRVTILFSEDEFDDLSSQAKAKNLGVSEYIRQVLSKTKFGKRGKVD